jgi:hypothetical protein
MDVGFPNPWKAADTVTAIAGIGAILLTIAGFKLQGLADRYSAAAIAPGPEAIGEIFDQQQARKRQEIVSRRDFQERAALNRRNGTVAFVLAVISGTLGSMPWLAFLALGLGALIVAGYAWRYFRGLDLIRRRREILEDLLVVQTKSTAGPTVFPSQMQDALNLVFNWPEGDLDNLARLVRNDDILRSDKLRAYAAQQKAGMAGNPGVTQPSPQGDHAGGSESSGDTTG